MFTRDKCLSFEVHVKKKMPAILAYKRKHKKKYFLQYEYMNEIQTCIRHVVTVM